MSINVFLEKHFELKLVSLVLIDFFMSGLFLIKFVFLQIPQTRFTRQCNMTAGQFPCLVKGCYTQEDICNGRPDCEDGFDESNCYDFAEWQQEQTLKFRLSR
jgi:hypothetical protein